MTDRLDTGEYIIETVCPTCATTVNIPATIEAVVKRKEYGGGSLGLALSHKAVPHDCATRQLTVDFGSGEVLP